MARWTDGYVADTVYTTNVYRELTPTWLAFACTLFGQKAPGAGRPLRFAELGCGQGLTSLVIAACHPESEVWGFDFNPAHIEAARDIAARADLPNVRFEERSFADLAAAPTHGPQALPPFDIVALHGVYSWVSAANRSHIAAFLGRFLAPGGLAYVSYNVPTGWAAMTPVRALMRTLADRQGGRSDAAFPVIAQFIEAIRAGGANYFAQHPSLEPRLKMFASLDARYLAHEYLNADWTPMMSADVAAELAEAKCSFIGSATLSDNIDAASVPGTMLPLLAEQRDPTLKETLRDFGNAQSFRRDIFRRGTAALVTSEHLARIDEIVLLGLDRPASDEITFATSVGQVMGKPEVYRPLLDALAEGPLTGRAARMLPAFAARPLAEALQAITLLVAGGYAHPASRDASPAARAATSRLNAVIAAMNAHGAAIGQLAAPAIGSALPADLIETLAVGEALTGAAADVDAVTDRIAAALTATGRHVQSEGKPVTDPATARDAIAGATRTALIDRAPLHRRMGILD